MKDIIRLRSEHEQDEANMAVWWRESPDADKNRIWDAIQKNHPADSVQELVTRFAQIGFTHMALLSSEEATP